MRLDMKAKAIHIEHSWMHSLLLQSKPHVRLVGKSIAYPCTTNGIALLRAVQMLWFRLVGTKRYTKRVYLSFKQVTVQDLFWTARAQDKRLNEEYIRCWAVRSVKRKHKICTVENAILMKYDAGGEVVLSISDNWAKAESLIRRRKKEAALDVLMGL